MLFREVRAMQAEIKFKKKKQVEKQPKILNEPTQQLQIINLILLNKL